MTCWYSESEEETRSLGASLAAELAPDGTLLLSGAMGSGKTVLVQGLASGLGIDPAEVQSPTFTLVHELSGDKADLIHIDLYRLDGEASAALGLEEIMARPAVKVVEWAEHLPLELLEGLTLRLERLSDGRRKIVVLSPSDLRRDS